MRHDFRISIDMGVLDCLNEIENKEKADYD